MIVRRRYRHDAIETEDSSPMFQDGSRRLACISLPPKIRQKRKPDIHIFQGISFYQAANPNRNTALLQFRQVQTKTQPVIHFNQHVRDIAPRGFDGSDAFIADEP